MPYYDKDNNIKVSELSIALDELRKVIIVYV